MRRLVLSALALLALAFPTTSTANTYEPTRKDDPVPGKCKARDCSLREAVIAAASRNGRDTVLLGRGKYGFEQPPPYPGGELNVGYGDTVRGQGAKRTRIDGNGLHRVFNVTGIGQRIERMTVLGGAVPGERGGGIYVCCSGIGDGSVQLKSLVVRNNSAAKGAGIHSTTEAKLVLTNSTVRNNVATGTGGGFYIGTGHVIGGPARAEIRNSTFAMNSADVGGGIAADATNSGNFTEEPELEITRSTISGNNADYGGGIQSNAAKLALRNSTVAGNTGIEGGGIDLRPGPVVPQTTIQASTISDNLATGKGGGMLVDGNNFVGPEPPEEPELEMVNSTVAENRSNGDGGGIMGDNSAILDINNSSIGFNNANDDNTGTAVAGGVYQHSNATFSVDSSVIADNDALGTGNNDDDCSAQQAFSGTDNAITVMNGCSVSFTPAFNTYSSPLVSELADNGGPTQTLAIVPPGVATGLAGDCPKRDQRGKLRPENCDSGSYENRPRR